MKLKIAWPIIRYSLSFYFLFNLSGSIAQQDSSSYEPLHMINLKNYNDIYQYWFRSDRNFTTGQAVEIFHPMFANKVANIALLGYFNTPYQDFSLALEQDIYTPTDIETTKVDTNDRPYAGLIYLDYAKNSNNFFKGKHFASHFIVGWIGKEALGREMQNGVHALLDNPLANGWANQLGSGLIVDYEFLYRQQLPLSRHLVEFSYFTLLHAGTLNNYGEVGGQMRFGHFGDGFLNHRGVYNSRNQEKQFFTVANFNQVNGVVRHMIPKRIRRLSVEEQVAYLNERQKRPFQFFMHLELKSAYSVYDGTAEGSLISFTPSPYSRESDDEGKWIFTASYGVHLQVNQFYVEFNRYLENDIYSLKSYFGYGQFILGWGF